MGETLDLKLKEERDLSQDLAGIDATRLSELEQEEGDLVAKIDKQKSDPQAATSPYYQENLELMYEQLKFVRGQKREITGEKTGPNIAKTAEPAPAAVEPVTPAETIQVKRSEEVGPTRKEKLDKLLQLNIDGKNIEELQALETEVRSYLTEDVNAHEASAINDMIEDIELLIEEQKQGKAPVRPEDYTTLVAPAVEETESDDAPREEPSENAAPNYIEKLVELGEEARALKSGGPAEEVQPVVPPAVAKPLARKLLTREQMDKNTAKEINAGLSRKIQGLSKKELQKYLLWIKLQFRWAGLGARQEIKIKLETKEAEVENALIQIPLPVAEAAPEAPSRKAEAIKKLKEAIENSQRILAENKIKRAQILARIAELESVETKTYSREFIEQKINAMLASVEAIKKLNHLEVKGKDGYLNITMDFKGSANGINVKGIVKAKVENKGDTIIVKIEDVAASWFDRKAINLFLKPQLDRFAEIIKSYIEKEEGKKVTNILIKDGQLEVTF